MINKLVDKIAKSGETFKITISYAGETVGMQITPQLLSSDRNDIFNKARMNYMMNRLAEKILEVVE